jgi:hypothetical protein
LWVVRRLIASRWPGVAIAIGSFIWSAVSPGLSAFVVLACGAAWAIVALSVENWRLRESEKPKLSLRFTPSGARTDLYDSRHDLADGVYRYTRVAVENSGGTVDDVAVLLTSLSPEHYPIFPMQELNQTHRPGTSRFAVHETVDAPTIYVDVVIQKLTAMDGPATEMFFALTSGRRPVPMDIDRYRIGLGIDGAGAGEQQHYELIKNDVGQFDMVAT